MKRREFLRTFIIGIITLLFGKKVNAEENPTKPLKEAMFWRRVD